MSKNGERIRTISKINTVVLVLFSIIRLYQGIDNMANGSDDMSPVQMVVSLASIFLVIILHFLLYGFAEMLDNSSVIANNIKEIKEMKESGHKK